MELKNMFKKCPVNWAFFRVLHFLVLIEKSISAIFILRSKIKQKEREDGWTPASQSMKGPSSHE